MVISHPSEQGVHAPQANVGRHQLYSLQVRVQQGAWGTLASPGHSVEGLEDKKENEAGKGKGTLHNDVSVCV